MLRATFVNRMFRMLLGPAAPLLDADALAASIGSREEFVAYLVLKTPFLRVLPDARIAFQGAVEDAAHEAVTSRSRSTSPPSIAKSAPEFGATLSTLLEADRKLAPEHEKLTALLLCQLRHGRRSGSMAASPNRWIALDSA